MGKFESILSQLGKALDECMISGVGINPVTPPAVTPLVATPPVVNPGNLFVGEPTMTPVMRQVVKLGVTANNGQYRVIVFDDGMMRVYQTVVGGYKQVSEGSPDTPKSGMAAYFTHGFMKENMDKVLWNVIGGKLFAEEVK
jgi:hypothetical protein